MLDPSRPALPDGTRLPYETWDYIDKIMDKAPTYGYGIARPGILTLNSYTQFNDENLTPVTEEEEQQYNWINDVYKQEFDIKPVETASPETQQDSTESQKPATEEPSPQLEPQAEPEPQPAGGGNFVSDAVAQGGSAIVAGAAGAVDWGTNLINRLTPDPIPNILRSSIW